jgi:N-acetylmuramoyl-L-alanine amidase
MKNILIAIFISALFYTIWFAGNYPKAFEYINVGYAKFEELFAKVENNVAAVLLHRPVTVAQLKDTYASPEKRVRILIVPGHEPGYGGAEYSNLKERELNVELSKYLGEFLKNNGRYDVMLARDNSQWSPSLMNYFISEWDEIIAFFKESKEDTYKMIDPLAIARNKGISPLSKPGSVPHVAARNDVALRLYGINKWSNENAIDIAIHVHFNDYPRAHQTSPGKYSGFAVYVPEQIYANSTTTRAVAENIFKRLAKYNAVSNLPFEDEGIVDESELIAIGAYNTANAASMLIEYGYIYEPQFQNEQVRQKTLRDLAFQTYLGLQDFFGSGNDVSFSYDTLTLPNKWEQNLSQQTEQSSSILALQSALIVDGFYPPQGKSKNDCPRTGKIGPCTLSALDAFQKRYGIKGEEGYVGEKTRLILNGKYSVRAE